MMDETTDFHPGESDVKTLNFGYVVYFEHIRHTLNLVLKHSLKR